MHYFEMTYDLSLFLFYFLKKSASDILVHICRNQYILNVNNPVGLQLQEAYTLWAWSIEDVKPLHAEFRVVFPDLPYLSSPTKIPDNHSLIVLRPAEDPTALISAILHAWGRTLLQTDSASALHYNMAAARVRKNIQNIKVSRRCQKGCWANRSTLQITFSLWN